MQRRRGSERKRKERDDPPVLSAVEADSKDKKIVKIEKSLIKASGFSYYEKGVNTGSGRKTGAGIHNATIPCIEWVYFCGVACRVMLQSCVWSDAYTIMLSKEGVSFTPAMRPRRTRYARPQTGDTFWPDTPWRTRDGMTCGLLSSTKTARS